jgi:uncharacterized membrane-anchored protein
MFVVSSQAPTHTYSLIISTCHHVAAASAHEAAASAVEKHHEAAASAAIQGPKKVRIVTRKDQGRLPAGSQEEGQ